MTQRKIQSNHRKRYRDCPVECPMASPPVTSVSSYLAILDLALKGETGHRWFRGHADLTWRLTPSALRYKQLAERERALALLLDFRRHADFRVDRPPPFEDTLKWMQLAQHHGLPTRLLDWTLNAVVALYFACLKSNRDGLIFLMDPTELNIRVLKGDKRLLDPEEDRRCIKGYLRLPGQEKPKGQKTTIAIQPVINNERIQMQRGAFTLHGNTRFELSDSQAPSLCYIPVLAEHKNKLMRQLRAIGVDELSIFPEPEHICSHLKRVAGLTGDANA